MVCAADLGTLLVHATSRAIRGQDCAGLDSGAMPWARAEGVAARRLSRAGSRAALPPERIGEVHPETVAEWITSRYAAPTYPGVVIGSPHGGVAHLAAALRTPWLPVSFRTSVRWPGARPEDAGAGIGYGHPLARALLRGDPSIAVHQLWNAGRDPRFASTVDFAVVWRTLPVAYRRFLAERLAPDATVILVVDPAADRILADDDRYRCQLDGGHLVVPNSLVGQLRSLVERSGRPMRIVLSADDALSAGVADVYRRWLRGAGKAGDRLVVECGRLLDPWHVLRAGLVPYWCRGAVTESVAAAELWLAGSEPFASVEILPEPPGRRPPDLADPSQWRAVAGFAGRRGVVDGPCRRGYPYRVRGVDHATRVLRRHPYDRPVPSPLAATAALRLLDDSAAHLGLLVL
jgi:hypothetical protein